MATFEEPMETLCHEEIHFPDGFRPTQCQSILLLYILIVFHSSIDPEYPVVPFFQNISFQDPTRLSSFGALPEHTLPTHWRN